MLSWTFDWFSSLVAHFSGRGMHLHYQCVAIKGSSWPGQLTQKETRQLGEQNRGYPPTPPHDLLHHLWRKSRGKPAIWEAVRKSSLLKIWFLLESTTVTRSWTNLPCWALSLLEFFHHELPLFICKLGSLGRTTNPVATRRSWRVVVLKMS